ncbi:arsenate reductase (glutaredoxin) [Pontibacter sp. JH31]|uniref:Arsenate reductase (Glutaredoxin) n=1 Tax=Pontibacter aquaedesilientis TaxID=2766980 RepID=A0ABR7XFW1_9BACT|nr:arsenate reductase (glutaredoxin) [Pontibacter aquaedesilientis]MBD1396493.1 arsenate reductase (glutaredoxin) [Pontibacter aquaedesilientis]
MVKIYHNKMCSKSRQTLELLQQKGVEVEVVEYLKDTPTEEELRDVLTKLNMKPDQLLRKGEKVYKENFAGQTHTDPEWIRIMVAHPILIERPIVVHGNKAAIGRPPEQVLSIL